MTGEPKRDEPRAFDYSTGTMLAIRVSRCSALALGILATICYSLAGGTAGAIVDVDEEGGVTGTLTYASVESEDRVPLEGAEIVVYLAELSSDGGEIVSLGESFESVVTGPDGAFEIRLPTPGDYAVELDLASLPEGIVLQAGEPLRALRLAPDQLRPQLFNLAGEDAVAAAEVASTGSGFWERVARQSVNGLKFGLILGMAAIGLSLIYGTTGLVNFAHAELITFGAVLCWWINTGWGLHMLAAAPLAVLLGASGSAALDAGFWRPLRERGTGLVAMMIVSIGLGITMRFVILYFFGERRRTYDQYSVQLDSLFTLGPVTVIPKDLIIIVVSAATLVSVGLVLMFTKLGKAMRAVSDNPDLAAASGIDVNRVITGVWFGAGALVTLGGIFLGLAEQIEYLMGFKLLLLVFAAVILGGLGTAFGAMFGAIVIGMFVELISIPTPPGWNDPLVSPELKSIGALAAMILILLIRPQGLLGRRERVG